VFWQNDVPNEGCLFSERFIQNMKTFLDVKLEILNIWKSMDQLRLGLWCLMPLSTIFQLYLGGQFIKRNKVISVILLSIISVWTMSHQLWLVREPLWSWSYGSWIYNYLCNHFLSLLTLSVTCSTSVVFFDYSDFLGVSDCSLMPTQQFFSIIMVSNIFFVINKTESDSTRIRTQLLYNEQKNCQIRMMN
jgi:glutaredoxin-related protein